MSRKKLSLILSLLSDALFVTYKDLKLHEGGVGMKSQSWLFTGFYFWFGSFFGLPGRGEVC
ncbi:MAG: hypothetical protein OEU57_05920 [Desulfuromonadales bacterium]|jgi:hypothetical protein|nr:hypothetical protein [Desulfuromonadales bacterium]MDH3868656.1 hypothetical protein [Desulfuromonadales bacterium]MDH4024945.1 hypothetical protein [Desulfuromonadales bacterium]